MRPYRYSGKVTIGEQEFDYGTGGWRRGSMPFGTFPVNIGKGDIGPVGKHVGAIATVGRPGGEIDDPKYPGHPREGIQIHPWSRPLESEGCFVIPREQWHGFCTALLTEAKKGQLYLTVDESTNAKIEVKDV